VKIRPIRVPFELQRSKIFKYLFIFFFKPFIQFFGNFFALQHIFVLNIKKMMTRLQLLSICLATTSTLTAQTTLKSSVLDDKEQPIPYANVLLLNAKDSAFIKASITDDAGKWAIESVEKGTFLVKTMMTSFKTIVSEPIVVNGEKELNLPTTRLQTQSAELQTVEIVQKKPFLEQRAGKMVVNVAESIAGSQGNLSDVLKKVPGLIIINNQVSMAGKSGVSILLDGKPTEYMDLDALLKEMPADQVDRIEVVSQPDARYDAAGTGGIINVIMKKGFSMGINGSVTAAFGYGILPKSRLAANISNRNKNFSSFLNASIGNRQGFEKMILTRQVGDLTFVQDNYMPYNPKSLNVRTGMDYTLAEKHVIGVSLGFNGAFNDRETNGETQIFKSDATLVHKLKNVNTFYRHWYNMNAEMFYNWEIDTSGTKLEWAANGSRFYRDANNVLQTNSINDTIQYPSRRNIEPGLIHVGGARLDFTYPVHKDLKFSTGGKLSIAHLDNELAAAQMRDKIWNSDANLSNHFIYDETIAALYGNMTAKLGKVEFQTGLRYEHTWSKGYSVTLNSVQLRPDYGKFFPSASISVPIVKQLAVMTAYSYRINRPNYRSLNPFVTFMDPFTYERGNPNLKPEFTHTGQFSLTWGGRPFFNLEYRQTNNAIQAMTEQYNATSTTFRFDANVAKMTNIGGHFFFPLSFAKGTDGYAGVMIYEQQYNGQHDAKPLTLKSTSYTGFMQFSYKINKMFKFETNGWYRKGGLQGLIVIGELYGVDMGLQGKFLDDHLELNLAANNLLFKTFNGKVAFGNQNYNINMNWEVRVFELSAKYKFGNRFLKERKKGKSGTEEETKRANMTN
jgi:ferric enterobactin receptor